MAELCTDDSGWLDEAGAVRPWVGEGGWNVEQGTTAEAMRKGGAVFWQRNDEQRNGRRLHRRGWNAAEIFQRDCGTNLW